MLKANSIGQSARKWFQSLTLLETNDKSLFHPPQRDACHSFILAEHKVMPPCILIAIGDKESIQSIHVCPTCLQGTHSFICIAIIHDSVDSFRSVDPCWIFPRDVQSSNSYLSFMIDIQTKHLSSSLHCFISSFPTFLQ